MTDFHRDLRELTAGDADLDDCSRLLRDTARAVIQGDTDADLTGLYPMLLNVAALLDLSAHRLQDRDPETAAARRALSVQVRLRARPAAGG
ncbi:hypothetical protein [Streptomyces sp. Ac-502]|uniref:hypothetical protein n=1 Tax=Streptomyces sp. Ac-502 TaxID=3342801 RepID=UPI003862BA39